MHSQLGSDVARFLSLSERGIITQTEAVGGLLDQVTVFLLHSPDAELVVINTLKTIPLPVLKEMEERLGDAQDCAGHWRWPPGGPGLADPKGSSSWSVADSRQIGVIESLVDCLGKCQE